MNYTRSIDITYSEELDDLLDEIIESGELNNLVNSLLEEKAIQQQQTTTSIDLSDVTSTLKRMEGAISLLLKNPPAETRYTETTTVYTEEILPMEFTAVFEEGDDDDDDYDMDDITIS